MREAADRLEAALGHEVKVRPRKGEEVAVEIRFDDLDEALALARRLGAAAAPEARAGRHSAAAIIARLRAISSVG